MLRRIMTVAPAAISGRANAGGAVFCLMNTPPKTNTIMIGVRSSIFASGARVRDRKQATATAEVCSDTQGSCLSSSVGADPYVGWIARGISAVVFDAAFPELNCPVYRRSVVR